MTESADPKPSEKDGTSLRPPSTPHISPATGRLADQVAAELARLTHCSALGKRKGLRVLYCAFWDGWINNHVMMDWIPHFVCDVDYEKCAMGSVETLARLRLEPFDLLLIDPPYAYAAESDVLVEDNCLLEATRVHELCAAAKALYPAMRVVVLDSCADESCCLGLSGSGPAPTPKWDAFVNVRGNHMGARDEVVRVLREVLGLPELPR